METVQRAWNEKELIDEQKRYYDMISQTALFPEEVIGDIPLEDVFEAYFDCRRKKRGTHNALAFEADYERKCIELWRDINAGTYRPSRSVAFIVFKPVQREVFAADFRDRVVHHLVARKIEPLLEAEFIDDSYSTRVGKGTLYGIRRCPVSHWKELPRNKSLFHLDGRHGLPIGNLTSQMMGNFLLSLLDHLITEQWGVPLYGQYVDDMVLVHSSREHLLSVRERIREWLAANGLTLHPRKMYLQHYSKGVPFVGGVVKPGRMYISNRTVGYFHDTLARYNRLAQEPGYVETHGEEFVASVNSYLGQMKHFATYNIRKRLLLEGGIDPRWWKVIYACGHLDKITLKKRYTARARIWRAMRREIIDSQLIKKEAV